MAFHDLSLTDRLVAVHIDFMKHSTFCILGGVMMIGKFEVGDMVPTAATDGLDVYYNKDFIKGMTHKQLRYLVGHEAAHKALHHCNAYKQAKEKYPEEMARAADYVVNGMLESMDAGTGAPPFLERPTDVPPLVNAKYADMSLLEVLRDLLRNKPAGQPMDEHMPGNPKDEAEVAQAVDDAVRHGEILQGQLRAAEGREGVALSGFRDRPTDWRGPLRRFLQELCEGEDQSRYSPPNKRFLPLDIVMPSHFSETTGEIVVACDTSGSMGSVLPLVFGEIAAICKTAQPKRVRVLWWDTQVRGEQVFEPKDYARIANVMQPTGGGGTTVSCVAQYIKAHSIKPKTTVMITDGYIEADYEVPAGNVLWGVVGNSRFIPLRGKVIHIAEM